MTPEEADGLLGVIGRLNLSLRQLEAENAQLRQRVAEQEQQADPVDSRSP